MEDVIRSIPTAQRIPNSMHMRMVYRSLINRGRSYAAYTRDEGAFISRVRERAPVLDPFSGFGLVHQYGAATDIETLGIEMNLPQYLWQRLNEPSVDSYFGHAVEALRNHGDSLPELAIPACAVDTYFSEESLYGIEKLFDWARDIIALQNYGTDSEIVTLALLLPFVGRFAGFSETSVAARTRQGGMILSRGWEKDFHVYLGALAARVAVSNRFQVPSSHRTLYGDSRTFDFSTVEFGAVLTSPPYPNTQDYFTMFEPEHQFVHWLSIRRKIPIAANPDPLIGQTRVKGSVVLSDVTEPDSVRRFFAQVDQLPMTERQKYDERIYYRRYHQLYFHGITQALSNVWRSATGQLQGYIFVVDNTHRGIRVPVAEAIAETLRSIGAEASVRSLGEQFHVGTKNPRARGVRAKHERFVIEVSG